MVANENRLVVRPHHLRAWNRPIEHVESIMAWLTERRFCFCHVKHLIFFYNFSFSVLSGGMILTLMKVIIFIGSYIYLFVCLYLFIFAKKTFEYMVENYNFTF